MNAQTITQAKLSDAALSELSTKLVAGLSWLDRCYGRAYILEDNDQRNSKYPGIPTSHSNGVEYVKLFPDSKLGNFAFFMLDNESTIEFSRNANTKINVDYAIIFWCDLRDAYAADWPGRTVEHLKYDVIRLLSSTSLQSSRGLTVDEITDAPDQIYREFNINQVDNQFLMRPYAGFRLSGSFTLEINC